MPFPSALTAAQLDILRTGRFYYAQYLLIWEQVVIFQAQINQATFAGGFATLTYDNVTVGAYTAIQSDFICYVSATAGKIQGAEHRFRIRADGSGTVATASVLNINETSAALEDDWYIMVVKDVGCEAKVPKTITADTPASYDYARDYAITFRRLLPIVYGLQTVYAQRLTGGVADFSLTAQVLLTDADAAAGTWSWDIDGMAFESGSSSTAAITARATTAGQYMPRVTYTDSAGNVGYFTFRVFVVPADYSSVINLAFANASITADTANGMALTISAPAADNRSLVTRIDRMPDLSFCAVWFQTNQPVPTSDIAFCGWFSSENVQNTYSSDGNTLLNTAFQVEGIAGRMGDTISRRLQMLEASTPTVFCEIENLTPWRAIAYFLTEHTTIPNICSVEFDDTSDAFRSPRFGSSDSSVLSTLLDILFTINATVHYARSGELALSRIAWYLPTASRNALDTVADWTSADLATGASGGPLFSVARAYVPRIGREMGGGGIYNTTSGQTQIMRAVTPGVAQSQGNELGTFNRQVLTANSAVNAGAAELGQRNADHIEALNPQTILNASLAPALWWLTPHSSQWHSWAINKSDNNRGIVYTSATRWTLRSISIVYQAYNGSLSVNAQFQKETRGTSYQTLITLPLDNQVDYYHPVIPVVPAYAAFPEEPNSASADPSAPAEADEPPFDADDIAVVSSPQAPNVSVQSTYAAGTDGLCWDDTHLWGVGKIPSNPVYTDFTPSGALATITNGKFDPFGKRALAISNDGVDTAVHHTKVFGDLQWTDTDVLGSIYSTVLPTRVIDKVYIAGWRSADPWTFTYDFSVSNGSWTPNDEGGGDRGIYTPPWDAVLVNETGTRAVVVQISKAFTATPITSVEVVYDFTVGEDSTSPEGFNNLIRLWTGGFGGTELDNASQTSGSGTDLTFTWTGTETADAIDLFLRSSRKVGSTPSPQGSASIKRVTITGTGVNPFGQDASTRFSDDFGATFEAEVGAGELTATEAGAATKLLSAATTIFMAIDDVIQAATNGGAYSAHADGDTTGSYALAIASFSGTGDAFVYGLAGASIAGGTLWLVNDATATEITPNDGANVGWVVGPNAIAIAPGDDQCIFVLATFDTTVKLAYSPDQGATWQFNTQVTANAHYIRAKVIGGLWNVYICDAASLWWGSWNGVSTSTITLQEKGTPSADLRGIELR